MCTQGRIYFKIFNSASVCGGYTLSKQCTMVICFFFLSTENSFQHYDSQMKNSYDFIEVIMLAVVVCSGNMLVNLFFFNKKNLHSVLCPAFNCSEEIETFWRPLTFLYHWSKKWCLSCSLSKQTIILIASFIYFIIK